MFRSGVLSTVKIGREHLLPAMVRAKNGVRSAIERFIDGIKSGSAILAELGKLSAFWRKAVCCRPLLRNGRDRRNDCNEAKPTPPRRTATAPFCGIPSAAGTALSSVLSAALHL